MWPHDHRVKSAKCGDHKSCGSGDIAYVNLWCKNRDIYDNLITKCDNSSDWNWTRTHNHLVRKRALNSLWNAYVTWQEHTVSVTIQFRRLFGHILYYKVRQSNFITKCDRLLLQVRQVLKSVTDCYYKVHQVLQTVTDFITKRVRHYKLRQLL